MRYALHSALANRGSVAQIVTEVRLAAESGLASYWAPMLTGQDTLTALAIAGHEVRDIELGTAVVPIPLRSPYALAQQVQTVQEAVAGRLVLGLGTSHEKYVTGIFGATWAPPLATAREYLPRLRSALGASTARPGGQQATTSTEVLLGAVNPAMIGLAVELADGVITWSAGEATIALVTDAIRGAGRQRPFRVVAALPFCVTDDSSSARSYIKAQLGRDDGLPSYQRVLAREGAVSVADLAVVGTSEEVQRRLAGFEASGVTDFAAHIVAATESDRAETWALLRQLGASA